MKTAKAIVAWCLAPLVALLDLINRLYEKHKFARRFTLHWSQVLITCNVAMFWLLCWFRPETLSKLAVHHMVYLGGITGLLAVCIGLYQWDAARDDARKAAR